MRNHYTKEFLEPIVKRSTTISEVCRAVGVNDHGWMNSYIGKKIKDFGIDTNHFLGRSINRGRTLIGNVKKLTPKQIFEKSGQVGSTQLRRALIEAGHKYECESCKNAGVWEGQPLRLHVDHRNGNDRDNREENLRFLCPNCHSQTGTYCRRNVPRITRKCRVCTNQITRHSRSGLCVHCSRKPKTGPVAKLVYAPDLGSGAERHGGSNPLRPTKTL